MAVKYLSGKRLQGTAAERTALNLASPPATSWKELGRITAGSGGSSSLTTSAFADKDNLMILYNSIGADPQFRVGNSSIDTGTNYALRRSEDYGSDGTLTSSPHNAYWYVNGGSGASGSEHVFGVTEGINAAAQEKLFSLHLADNADGTGAGTGMGAYEIAMKWANTSNQINIWRMFSSGTMAEGSEVVVLGMDNDEADSGTNFWQELASEELSSSAASITASITAKKYIYFEWNTEGIPAGNETHLRLGNSSVDTGSNYAYTYSVNGGSASAYNSKSFIKINNNAANEDNYGHGYIINKSDKEKLVITEMNETVSGAGNSPMRQQTVAKWVNTSNQFDKMQIKTSSGSNFGVGTYIKVWGAG